MTSYRFNLTARCGCLNEVIKAKLYFFFSFVVRADVIRMGDSKETVGVGDIWYSRRKQSHIMRIESIDETIFAKQIKPTKKLKSNAFFVLDLLEEIEIDFIVSFYGNGSFLPSFPWWSRMSGSVQCASVFLIERTKNLK